MADNLERTDVYQQHHEHVTGEVPLVLYNPDESEVAALLAEQKSFTVHTGVFEEGHKMAFYGLEASNMFDDDAPISGGLENPEICESCT
jgi:hypothetical protein